MNREALTRSVDHWLTHVAAEDADGEGTVAQIPQSGRGVLF
jgi:hypothetical protein